MKRYAIVTDAQGVVVDCFIGTNIDRMVALAQDAGLLVEVHPAPGGMTLQDLYDIAWPRNPEAARSTLATVVIR